MNSTQQELWSTIRSFDIDGGPASLTFSKRLARENGWSLRYADRVIEEYKRFVYLCMAAGHPCTPSDEVDQAWHLHLTYTESYWTRFCGETLPRPLHHGPTKGGAAEDEKFVDWYERTKSSYIEHFQQEPPTDIWPSSKDRFANAAAWKRIDVSKFWMIPRKSTKLSTQTALGITAILIGGIGCSYLAESTANAITTLFIFGAFLILVIALILLSAVTQDKKRESSGCSTGGCSSTSVTSCSSNHDSGHGGHGGNGCGSHSGGDSGGGDGGSGCGGGGCGGGGCGGGGCGS